MDRQGLELVSLIGYAREHGRLPYLEWAMLAGLAAIAGAGGLSNSLFSNYTRDKGWGMGARVGAIPSAVGGMTISLSHVGEVFAISRESLQRVEGLAPPDSPGPGHLGDRQLSGHGPPLQLSLEFIRNAPISGNRVGAMVADGLASRYPDFGYILWAADPADQLPGSGSQPDPLGGQHRPGAGPTSSGR